MAQNQMVCQFCETSTIIKWKCVNCDLILCDECNTRIHSKSQSSKEHDVLDLKEFNTNSAVEIIRTLDLKNIQCASHASEKCIIYCQDCKILLCSSCLIEFHTNHKLGKIDEIYKQKLQELKEKDGKSSQQMKLLSENHKELDTAMLKGQTQYNVLKQKIFQREAEIKEAMIKQSENLVKELNKFWQAEEEKIAKKIGEIEEQKGDLSQQISHIQETLHSQKAMTIFTACDTTRGILKKDLPELPNPTDNSVKQIILSQPSPIATIFSLGSLRIIPEMKVINSYHSDLQSIYKIKTKEDNTNVLSSIHSKVICKFELKDSKCLTSAITENVQVLDMTISKHGSLLFSIKGTSELNCITNLSTDTTIETYTSIWPLNVRGIHATDKNILIGFCDDGKLFPLTADSRRGIIVQDYNGRHIRTMECNTNNDRIFSLLHTITTNINADICVVDLESNKWNGRVVVLTELGSVKWTYTGHYSINITNKFTPLDLVTTNDGFILVADRESNAIHMLSMDGDFLTSLNAEHGIEVPLCVNIDKSGKLLIGTSSNTSNKVAKLIVVKFN